ncbi:uncharacterized protein BX663DRAFT_533156 [Cokeromyces recurvatus]|uniref:uncharacterized protein n=1 Tax=Cokeromyces recurvatus TaxID=90255 RepID=UPI002220CA1E|nr:uncharacterized protein BX663DRAFT_533156 [Cokeromyces recurvatus]KAI7898797.1 hypothetical protein BX663DRAFT_533156 [Cokeromyces recurvatus]
MIENDRQMINARLYPLGYNGIAILLCLSLYDKIIRSDILHLSNAYSLAKEFIGIVLNLLRRSSDRIQQADKSVFVLLYFADHIQKHVSFDDLKKYVPGPYGNEHEFQAIRIIEVLSSAAATCPDSSIRYLLYKLIERFINSGDDEVRVFFMHQLLEHCPFPSMNTAAISLLKDQIGNAFKNEHFSIFKSPYVFKNFFPLIFKLNSDPNSYWENYNYIMQALNLYYYLLNLDRKKNIVSETKRKEPFLIYL